MIVQDEFGDIVLTVTQDVAQQFRRLDLLLVHELPFSREFLKHLYEEGHITSESSSLSLKKKPVAGTVIYIHLPPPIPSDAIPEDIPLDILYEDDYLIFLNKPAGLVVHPAPGHPTGTLVNALLHHCPNLKGIGGVQRPGIVHRLDRGTSGVMVVAKEQKTHEGLILLFSSHDLLRRYEALVVGNRLPPVGTIESLIGRHPHHRQKMSSQVQQGKKAITDFKVLHFGEIYSHVELELQTGRTHQIRVHLTEKLNSPLLMDPLYGRPSDHLKKLPLPLQEHLKTYEYPFLHAKTLGLVHPITGKYLEFTVKPPEIWEKLLIELV